jgi:Rieske Fe-S protein
MARDAVLQQPNPWSELFDARRVGLSGGVLRYLQENKDYPVQLIKDWLARPEAKPLGTLAPGAGELVEIDGEPIAAYRDERGELVLLSPTCTHLGCRVTWNAAEKTWDCPCHGSRFLATGDVLAGPAERPLSRAKIHG